MVGSDSEDSCSNAISTSAATDNGCGNAGARLGCRTCGIHLCSPECYNAHAFDNAELCGKMCATFLSVSKFKAKKAGSEGDH